MDQKAERQTLQILELLHTFQEACMVLYTAVETENTVQFQIIYQDIFTGLRSLRSIVDKEDSTGYRRLKDACQSIQASLYRVKEYCAKSQKTCLQKIEFELFPMLQGAYILFYYFQYLADHPEKLSHFYNIEKKQLFENVYLNDALETGKFKYEVSIVVLAYNKLEYTKMCVENLLRNIPEGLNYELILMNNGSRDGTKEYFENVHPHKQLDVEINGGSADAIWRIVEGEFTLFISNDVIVTPHAIENMLTCLRFQNRLGGSDDPQCQQLSVASHTVRN